ncbi:MAG: hypothetical protein JRJ77_15730 [Deltaproteobacteria bacterium]|nr:hypothetical protein [Deltaproteobacteria bacterium]
MSVNILELIQYITWLSTEREEALSPIRLVKFIYLADLYYAKENKGVTLTGWTWKFVHYGPFCVESLQAIKGAVDKGVIEAFSFESQFDDEEHFLYKHDSDMEPSISSILPYYVTGPLQAAIGKWAGDTYGLLDHIYFETEPMKNVHPGDILDFSKIQEVIQVEKISIKKLSKRKLAEGKKLISVMRERQSKRIKQDYERPIFDKAYVEALSFLNGEGLDVSITGEAEIEDSVTELD